MSLLFFLSNYLVWNWLWCCGKKFFLLFVQKSDKLQSHLLSFLANWLKKNRSINIEYFGVWHFLISSGQSLLVRPHQRQKNHLLKSKDVCITIRLDLFINFISFQLTHYLQHFIWNLQRTSENLQIERFRFSQHFVRGYLIRTLRNFLSSNRSNTLNPTSLLLLAVCWAAPAILLGKKRH